MAEGASEMERKKEKKTKGLCKSAKEKCVRPATLKLHLISNFRFLPLSLTSLTSCEYVMCRGGERARARKAFFREDTTLNCHCLPTPVTVLPRTPTLRSAFLPQTWVLKASECRFRSLTSWDQARTGSIPNGCGKNAPSSSLVASITLQECRLSARRDSRVPIRIDCKSCSRFEAATSRPIPMDRPLAMPVLTQLRSEPSQSPDRGQSNVAKRFRGRSLVRPNQLPITLTSSAAAAASGDWDWLLV